MFGFFFLGRDGSIYYVNLCIIVSLLKFTKGVSVFTSERGFQKCVQDVNFQDVLKDHPIDIIRREEEALN